MLPSVKIKVTPEPRRRSPVHGQGHGLPSSHPFLDSERSAEDAAEEGGQKALLSDWVPGVARSQDYFADQTIPSAMKSAAPGNSSHLEGQHMGALESQTSSGRRSWKSTLWLSAGITFLGLVVYTYVAYGTSGGKSHGTPLAALGEGENREDFVRVSGTQFMLDCRPFYVAGFNAHDLVPKVLATTQDHKTFENREGKELVGEMLRNASMHGLNVARVYAHTSDPEHPFMIRPGEYSEEALEALDFVMETARQQGLKVSLSFADNWKYPGGVDEMVDWSKTAPKRKQKRPADQTGDFDDMVYSEKVKEFEVARHSLFFNDSGSRTIFKNHIKHIVTRRNTLNGRLYSEDPTVMAWGLLNEPRCETWLVPECKQTFPAWVSEMSAYVKSLDQTHLVTIGEEGFFGEGTPQTGSNPQTWGSQIGQDFAVDHAASSIDFATLHFWPQNWERNERAYLVEWLDSHMKVAEKTLRKPVILEEFGKKLVKTGDEVLYSQAIDQLRNPVFDTTYQLVQAALEANRPLRGAMFWRWDLVIYNDQVRADYGVRPYDTTFATIKENAALTGRMIAATPPAASCGLQCWTPTASGKDRSCTNKPKECTSLLAALKTSKTTTSGSGVKTYPTHTACCRPGLGAFPEGCTMA